MLLIGQDGSEHRNREGAKLRDVMKKLREEDEVTKHTLRINPLQYIFHDNIETYTTEELILICASRGFVMEPTADTEEKRKALLAYLKRWLTLSHVSKAKDQVLWILSIGMMCK